MSDDMEFARKKAEAEAAERFSRILSGEANEADYQEIQLWRASADVNDAAWRRVSLAWSASGTLAGNAEVNTMRAAALARGAGGNGGFAKRWRPVALAAGLLAAVGVGPWVSDIRFAPGSGADVIASATPWSAVKRTAIGEIQSLALDDGSAVTINTDSALRTAFSETGRQVQLSQGEAYFDVASDSSRPFSVEAGDIVVTAVGTAFSVRRTDDDVIVTLTEGEVRVETNDRRQHAMLSPGMQLRASGGDFRTIRVDAARATSWTSGMLDFYQAPLGTVIEEMNRYTTRSIRLDDPDLASRPVTGLFPARDHERFIQMLVASESVRVKRRSADNVELGPS